MVWLARPYHRARKKPAGTGSVLSIADLQEARPCWTLRRIHLSANVMWNAWRNAHREEGSLSAGPGRVGNSFSLSVIRGLGRQTTSGSNDSWKRKYLNCKADRKHGLLPAPCCYLGIGCLRRVSDSSTTCGGSHIFLLFAQWDICLPNCCMWKFYMLLLLAETKYRNKPSLSRQLLSEAI